MAENTSIPWCHHTFNGWIGCEEKSPGCKHCYAKIQTYPRVQRAAGRELWGHGAERHDTSEAAWRKPLAWNRAALAAGERHRVFAFSLGDVFENRHDRIAPRLRFLRLMWATPGLDWLVLTKRPECIRRHLAECLELEARSVPVDKAPRDGFIGWLSAWCGGKPPANVWLGCTVEDQKRADERIHRLAEAPAVVRFLSMEPLLESVDVQRPGWADVHWVIVGGESGHHARPFNVEWARALHHVSAKDGKAFFMKQVGAKPMASSSSSASSSGKLAGGGRFSFSIVQAETTSTWTPIDAKGESLEDLPEDLRVRDFPKVSA